MWKESERATSNLVEEIVVVIQMGILLGKAEVGIVLLGIEND